MSDIKFGSLFEFIRNGMNVRQDKSGAGLPITRIETISDSVVDETRVGYAGLEELDCRSWLLEPGDILFSHINSVEHLGKCALYEGRPSRLIHGMNLLCLRSDRTKIVPGFAKYLIRSAGFRSQLAKSIKKAVNQASVSIGDIKAICLGLPSLDEQRRIAEVLDRAEALRAKRRAALTQLDTLTQAIFFDMFATRGSGERTIGDLLEAGVIELHKDGNHGSSYPRADDFGEDGVPFLSAKAISDDGMIDHSLVEHLREQKASTLRIGWIRKGDVLLAHNASVGKVALYDGRYQKALIGTSLTAFRPNPKSLDPKYLVAALRSARFQESLKGNMSQTTRNQVPITAQRQLKIFLPPIASQREFAQRAELVQVLKARETEALVVSDELFSSVQKRAFRGDLF